MSSFPDLPEMVAPGGVYDALHWGPDGLLPVIAIDATDGVVLMAAYANRCALAETLRSGWATYWSRSRSSLWLKGSTSGNRQRIVEVRCDCDGDHLLYSVIPDGPSCHTGRRSCFSWRVTPEGGITCDRALMAAPGASP